MFSHIRNFLLIFNLISGSDVSLVIACGQIQKRVVVTAAVSAENLRLLHLKHLPCGCQVKHPDVCVSILAEVFSVDHLFKPIFN